MIGWLEGKQVWSDADTVCVEAGGVGYVIKPVHAVSPTDDKVSYFVYHVIREDSQALYGFSTIHERQLFEIFISVSGVGPALALASLRKFPTATLIQVIRSKDAETLCEVPGVGRKTAERLMVELHAKVESKEFFNDTSESELTSESVEDAYEVLIKFGYAPGDIRKVLSALDGESDAGDMVLKALSILKGGSR